MSLIVCPATEAIDWIPLASWVARELGETIKASLAEDFGMNQIKYAREPICQHEAAAAVLKRSLFLCPHHKILLRIL